MESFPKLFLSRLVLNPRNRDVRGDLANCHRLHQRIMTAFPSAGGDAPRAEFGILYRPEIDARSGIVTLLVQSRVEPDWSRLPQADGSQPYLLPGPDNPAVKPIGQVLTKLQPGQRLIFRLRANPTKRLATRRPEPRSDPLLGKRVALLKEEEQLGWLKRQAERAGFAMLSVQARPDRSFGATQRGYQREPSNRPLSFGAVIFDGLLEITDVTRFCQAIMTGIGPGKAYGFGLLSLARG
jgi:CRISPR system Cascade subunit CasE